MLIGVSWEYDTAQCCSFIGKRNNLTIQSLHNSHGYYTAEVNRNNESVRENCKYVLPGYLLSEIVAWSFVTASSMHKREQAT